MESMRRVKLVRERSNLWGKTHRAHRNEQQRNYRKENPTPWREATKRWRLKVKVQGISAYGGRCKCCGETEIEFLTFDHVAGGGNKHRTELKRQGKLGGGGMWLVAKQEGYPPAYRVLCWNCQWSARLHNGICIHQRISKIR